MKYVLTAIGAIVALLGLTWAFQGDDFFLYKTFAPKYEAVRRQTFEQSKAYNQGMAQDLQKAEMEYARASESQRDAIASVIVHRFADYDTSRLPEQDRQFLAGLRARQGL